MPADLVCDRCGYDLRAHPPDGNCPECGESVAESRRLAAIPRRPAWRDSDPRWRRRMLAGVWILVLIPLANELMTFEWASNITIPNIFGFPGALRLDETFLFSMGLYESMFFCMGVALLFSNEHRRRLARLDRTCPWGVLCSYVVLLLSAAQILYLGALVLAGIAALFLSMPPKYQPEATPLFIQMSTAYLRYGPYPHDISVVVLVAFSSTTILLACVPLFNALRSSGPKRVAAILLTPLALFALIHLAQVGAYCLGISSMTVIDLFRLGIYFRPALLFGYIGGNWPSGFPGAPTFGGFVVEAVKWWSVLAIAIWLSIAQFAAWRRGRNASSA